VSRTIAAIIVVGGLLAGCNIVPSRDPTGERLPIAEGRTLDGTPTSLAEALAGEPAILFLPFTDDGQFDADRWAMAFHQLETPVRRFEIGAVPSAFGIVTAPIVDRDRRRKRAEIRWPEVLVFTGDSADRIVTQTGMGDAQFARVLLVDREGTIVRFCALGFTPERASEFDRAAREFAR
jgi:hypothetical protein